MLAFGGNLTGANILNYIARNLDKVLLGWRWGPGPVGFYEKAMQLLLLPVRQINAPLSGVAIPALSRLQDKPDHFRGYYCRGIGLIVFVGMPVVALAFVAADELVLALLGPQWVEVALIFRMLGPAAMLATLNMATGWVFVSTGQTHRQLRWSIIGSAVTTLAFVAGLPWGAVGVAATFSISRCVLILPSVAYCFRFAPVKVADLLGVLWRPLLASVAAGAGTIAVSGLVNLGGSLPLQLALRLALYLLTFGSLYILIWLVLPGGRQIVRDTLALVRELRAGTGE
jgi:PST family polysaccharide transporter